MDAVRTVLTYEDYASLPNDGRRYEIRDGELSVTPTPTFRHQRVVTALLRALADYVDAHDLGEMVPSSITVVLADTTIVERDIIHIAIAVLLVPPRERRRACREDQRREI